MSFEVPSIHVRSVDPAMPSVRLQPTSVAEAEASGHFPLGQDITQFLGTLESDMKACSSAEAYYDSALNDPDMTTLEWGIHVGNKNTYIGNASIWQFNDIPGSQNFAKTSLFITHPDEAFRGRRYGLATNLALAHYGFNHLGKKAMCADIDPPNAPSIKMHKKMGYLLDDMPDEENPLYFYILLNPNNPESPNFGYSLPQMPAEELAKARDCYLALAALVDIEVVA